MIYFLPLGRGVSKAISNQGWGTQFNSFWCCYGTGIESFSKLGDSIYYEEESQEGLYIVQFISSIFNWKSGGLIISQKVEAANSWDRVLRISFDLTAIRETDKVTMNVRIPLWTGSIGAQGKLNGEYISLPAPGTFLSIKRKWNSGDSLILEMPMPLWTETIKDDRPQFSSIKAILYGPYLLAGLSNGDWDIKTGAHNSSPSEWMAAVPATHSTQLISLSQTFSNRTFVLMNRNSTITMETLPEPGTNSAVHATFRVVCDDADSTNLSSRAELVGKSVRLEPFDLPGTVVVQQGPNKHLLVSNAERTTVSSLFYIVEALDGDGGSISLESKIQKGCFLYSGVDYSAGLNTKISCQPESTDVKFQQAASFRLGKGLSEYHNISFVVHGSNRNFLMMPLLCLRDEHYTVYFNMGT